MFKEWNYHQVSNCIRLILMTIIMNNQLLFELLRSPTLNTLYVSVCVCLSVYL